ncbi:hypothetical protein CF392_04545 [Tamilnaduibacter salinus]|uniref:DUF6160 domain-containing protein n=1 Tax=Tamilnaduibacter salinus TaxID=1484056 RepID=A0A2A2I4U0_9GAMM|nr:DUF6160 family protein [Tamilnaduibacter salinus]PAV26677.1 hypothetical protein CF392_04545 [Tamilnaduibacter salinus]
MKGLKLSTLALAVASLPLAGHAELKPMNNADMGNVTGQSGVTIELETRVAMDEFRYTDEGSLSVSDITIGGANRDDLFPGANVPGGIPNDPSDKLDNLKLVVDVEADGDAVIDVLPLFGSPVDFGISTGEWNLESSDGSGDSTLLMDNLSMEGMFGSMDLRVDTETDTLNFNTRFAIDDFDADVSFLGVGIRDLRITGSGYDDNPNVVTAFAQLDMDIYSAPNAAGTDSLAVDINDFSADVEVGGVLIGGTSIGSLKMNNLSVTGTQMRVYGHQ